MQNQQYSFFFSDIVGYSKIVERDESMAHRMLKEHNKIIEKAGIENAGGHTLRKTAGAFYYMATRDIYATKEWMGHSDISITIKHYSGLMQSMKREDDLAFENLLTAQLMGQL